LSLYLKQINQAVANLQQSETRLVEAQHIAKMGDFVWEVESGIVTRSKGLSTILGYDAAELSQFTPDMFHPEDRERAIQWLDDCIAARDGVLTPFEYRVIHKDGSVVAVIAEGVIDYNDEQHATVFGTIQNITERKEIMRKQAETEQFSQKLLSTISNGVYILDLVAWKNLYVNEQYTKLTGYTLDDLSNMSRREVMDLIHPEDRPVIDEYTQHLQNASDDEILEVEFRYKKADGKWAWFMVWIVIFERDESSKVTKILGSFVDITERKQTQENHKRLEVQIQHAQKLESLGILAGGIAHDFNNLLTGILGNVGLATMKVSTSSPSVNNLKQIEEAAIRASELCNQMLAYSGKGRFVVQPFSLNDIIEEMIHLLKVSISKTILLNLDLYPNLPATEGDVTQLRQIIMNLVINASDAIGDRSGVITISTGVMDCEVDYLQETYLDDDLAPGPYTYVEVSDTGTGMDEATREKIFDPFFTTKFTGRGLGLAAVLGIVRGHSGAIKVYSEPKRGTTFKVLFPCSDLAAILVPSSKTNMDQQWQGSGHILIVDDEETVRAVGRQILESIGFSVLTANDGREGFEIFKIHQAKIVLVLLDLTMPHMDGEETFRELRRLQSDVPVILSSGYNEQETTNRFAGKGLAGFIQKPYRSHDLAAKVKAVLDDVAKPK
ncbi:MAG: PAS domain-containing protein, partial [Chloroflexota bacterium]